MARVTGKLQVTVPKAIADHFGIRPGDDIDWVPAGDVIRVVPPRRRAPTLDRKTRLSLFDAATARQKRRQGVAGRRRTLRHRGWRRENPIPVAALVDTNVLVYRFDPGFPDKQARATALLRRRRAINVERTR